MSTGAEGQQTDEGDGERTAERLFVDYYDFMFAWARTSLKQKADAEDVIQTLFFKLANSELPADIWNDPKGYLYRTVINACHDWRRSRKGRKEQQRVEELEFVEARSERANVNAAHEVDHLLNGLDNEVAGIVMLHAESGMSDAEIAAMMGATRSKIASILSRTREKLKKMRRGGAGPPKESAREEISDAEE